MCGMALSAIDEIDRLEIEQIAAGAGVREPVSQAEAPRTIQAGEALQPLPADKSGRPGGRPTDKISEQTVRTSVERLDNLMNLVGELITDRNRVFQLRTEFEAEYRGEERVENLSTTITHIGRITDQLQAEVMRIRMQPISFVFNKFPRLVRDLARKANKEINFTMRGEDTELDRSVIENISDPAHPPLAKFCGSRHRIPRGAHPPWKISQREYHSSSPARGRPHRDQRRG